MATVKIECVCTSCGKTFEHRKVCRNTRVARDYEEWAKTHIDTCPDCYRAEREAAVSAKIADAADKFSLPALVGTEKQVAWALKIRDGMIREHLRTKFVLKVMEMGRIDELLDKARAATDNPSSSPEDMHEVELVMQAYKILTETSAVWFINNR